MHCIVAVDGIIRVQLRKCPSLQDPRGDRSQIHLDLQPMARLRVHDAVEAPEYVIGLLEAQMMTRHHVAANEERNRCPSLSGTRFFL